MRGVIKRRLLDELHVSMWVDLSYLREAILAAALLLPAEITRLLRYNFLSDHLCTVVRLILQFD